MTDDGYTVDPKVLENDARQKLQAAYDKLKDALGHLDTAAKNFTAANNGQAVDSYTDAQQQWTTGTTNMNDGLAMMSQKALPRIAETYSRADITAAGNFGN